MISDKTNTLKKRVLLLSQEKNNTEMNDKLLIVKFMLNAEKLAFDILLIGMELVVTKEFNVAQYIFSLKEIASMINRIAE